MWHVIPAHFRITIPKSGHYGYLFGIVGDIIIHLFELAIITLPVKIWVMFLNHLSLGIVALLLFFDLLLEGVSCIICAGCKSLVFFELSFLEHSGWRLDYFLVSDCIADKVHDSYILPDVTGSDHCPIGLILKL